MDSGHGTTPCQYPFLSLVPYIYLQIWLPDVYSQPSLNVQTALVKVWHFVKGGSVASIHPPLDDLTFLLKDVAHTATPFRKGREGDTAATCADVQKIHQQPQIIVTNNFADTFD